MNDLLRVLTGMLWIAYLLALPALVVMAWKLFWWSTAFSF